MRTFFRLIALACAGTAALAPAPVRAQASVDPRALEPLQAAPAAPAPQHRAKPSHPSASHPSTSHRTASHPAPAHAPAQSAPPPAAAPAVAPPASRPAAAVPPAPNAAAPAARPPAPAAPLQVRVPLTPPPPPVLPPALAVPTRPPPPPSPAPVAADAPGAPAQIADGLRVTFGEGRADLNPGTEAALRALAHAAAAASSFTVAAFAPGTPEDPSTPRRLSLSRALTVRSVLIAEGVASVRIYVKALGASQGIEAGPADRVDVTLAAPSQERAPQ